MKKIASLLIVFLLLACLTVTVYASGGSPKIIDNANVLTTVEEVTLETMALALVNKYDMDVVILIEDSIGLEDVTDYADDYFDYNGYGIGSNHSGVLLLLDMEEREWAISTCGNTIDALTDYGQDQIMDEVLEYLGDDEYFDGFRTYLELLDEYFEAYENGDPIDKPRTVFNIIFDLIIALGIGAIAGGITITIMKSGMKTVRPQRGAQSYVKQGSFTLNKQRDMFLYSNTSRVRKSSSSSGGGSSTHRSSSGRSHGGSRGRF
jgi:uncharacterized protein